jgi:plasmid rolling circle replication initiator protein Rep
VGQTQIGNLVKTEVINICNDEVIAQVFIGNDETAPYETKLHVLARSEEQYVKRLINAGFGEVAVNGETNR